MFQYTNTIVLNSLIDEASGLNKIDTSVANVFNVRRVNAFKTALVDSVYKRPGTAAVLGSAVFSFGSLPASGSYRVKLYIRLSGSQNSYYSNNFVYKGKPLYYEFAVTSTDTLTTIYQKIAKSINLVNKAYGDNFIKVVATSTDVTINCTTEYQLITEAVIQKLDESANSALTNEVFEDFLSGTITKSVEGFGNYEHLIKDLRLPTIEARTFEAVNKEELPIQGALYTQYTLYYTVDRGIMGGSSLGQKVTSKTTHVFYVLSTLVSSFEASLVAAGLSINTVGIAVTDVTITSGILDISNTVGGTPYQITYTTTPSGATGAVFTLNTSGSTVAGTPDWTKVTVSNSGAISLATGHGLAAADVIGIKVTIDGITLNKGITLQA